MPQICPPTKMKSTPKWSDLKPGHTAVFSDVQYMYSHSVNFDGIEKKVFIKRNNGEIIAVYPESYAVWSKACVFWEDCTHLFKDTAEDVEVVVEDHTDPTTVITDLEVSLFRSDTRRTSIHSER